MRFAPRSCCFVSSNQINMNTIKCLIYHYILFYFGLDINIRYLFPVIKSYLLELSNTINRLELQLLNLTQKGFSVRYLFEKYGISMLYSRNLCVTAVLGLIVLQATDTQAQTLDEYIAQGLQNNEVVHQKNFALEKAHQMLKEAKGAFYPTVSLLADYNYASGGRSIDLPLGDLFNPVYTSLNKLSASNQFPKIDNQSIQLAPNNFSDTRLNTTLQLVNAEIRYNYKIKKEAITQQQAEVNVYKRELIRSIKGAYFNMLLAIKQKAVIVSAGNLLSKNFRYTKSLVDNGRVLKGSLLRIQSDINSNQAKLTAVENDYTIAKAHFNFLLNKGFTEEVNVDTTLTPQGTSLIQQVTNGDLLERREERQSLKSGIKQAEIMLKIKKSFYIPTLSTFASTGFQGTGYHFGSSERYTLGGISLKWTLFNGFQSSSRIRQAAIDVDVLNSRLENLEKEFNVQLITAQAGIRTATEQLKSAASNQEQSREYYRETTNRYAQGRVLLVELTDAYTQYINNQQSYQIAIINLMNKNADLEQVTASYPL
jgi:outer membrane protein